MMSRECFTCSKLKSCSRVDVELVLQGYVCNFFEMAQDPVIEARSDTVGIFGFIPAVRNMMSVPRNPQQEERLRMSSPTPAPGTTYSERRKQLDVMSYSDVRHLAAEVYKKPDQTPLVPWIEALAVASMANTRQTVLDFELSNGLIVPDNQQGEAPMAQQFAPPPMPPGIPPQQPMPGAPPPFAPPGAAAPPMPPPQAAPMAPPMPPQAAPAPPYGMAPPPGSPPPVATAQEAAQAAVTPPPMEAPPPQTGKKKTAKGAAVAPAPPPPPSPAPVAPPAPQAQQFAAPPVPQPQWQPPGAPAPQFAPPAAPAPVGVDLSPVVQLLNQVGSAVNTVGAAADTNSTKLLAAIAEVRTLILAQTVALHHIYTTSPALQQAIQGKDVSDVSKFVTYLQSYLPR